MYRYTNVASYSHPSEPPISFPRAPNFSGTPERVGHQASEASEASEASLSKTAFDSRIMSSNHDFEAITIKDHVLPLNLAQAPATLSAATRSSSIATRVRMPSYPGILALAVSSAPSAVEKETAFPPLLTEITAVPTTAVAGTGSTVQPSLSSHTTETAPAQTSTTSPVDIGSARTTGIIIGSVLGGTAVLIFAVLAVIYLAWRRRRKRRDQAGKGADTTQQQLNEATSRAGNGTNDAEWQKRMRESPTILPLRGITIPRPITFRSEPIINDISPITPLMPHLSRWTLEKADIPSPAGHHPAIIDTEPNLRHHPLFASAHYDGDGDHTDAVHAPHDASPRCSSSSSSFSPAPNPPSPAATAAAAEAEAQALASFLFFDSPSSRSSRRPSTRDSSAPCTALGVPPPLHRGPPPRRRHTRAGGQGDSARSRRGSRSSVGGNAESGVANSTGQHTPPPPVPARNGARSKSLRGAERPAAWI